jgi:hypothetical protein
MVHVAAFEVSLKEVVPSQPLHVRSEVAVPSFDTYVPGAQVLTARHARLPWPMAKSTSGVQFWHVISPVSFWNWPVLQASQSPLTSRLPTAHFEHSRSTVEEPKKEGYSPAAHGVNAVHVTAF